MNAQGMFSIGGIASGMDTAGIIDQLLALERQPIKRIENTQEQLRKVDSAWQQVNTRLSSLRTAVDAINRPDRFADLVAVTSTNSDAVGVSRGTGSATGSLTFSVGQLAQSHQLASGTFASSAEPLGMSGTFAVTVGQGDAVEVELSASDTLTSLANKLNAKRGDVTATVVKQGEGEFRLVLNSTKTGGDNTIAITLPEVTPDEVTQFGDGQTTTLREAQDAKILLGSGENAITLTRASNTVTDLVPGASITLKKVTDAPVTVTSARDVDGGVKAVKDYVDAINSVINELAKLTSYDAETKTAGALQGDPNARQLLNSLRAAVTAPLGFAGSSSAFDVGVGVDRNGKVTLDEAKLRTALTNDFDAVGRVFGRNAVADNPLVSGAAGGTATTPGGYQLEITAAAKAAKTVGATLSPEGPTEPKTFRVTSGGRTAVITINTEHATSADIVAAINAALEEANITTVAAREDAGSFLLEESRYGSSASFRVEELVSDEDHTVVEGGDVWGLEGTWAGQNAAGRIRPAGGGEDDWVAMTGSGRSLSVGSGPASGFSMTWTGTEQPADGEPFAANVTFTHGLAGNLGNTLRQAEGIGGLVARARAGITNQIQIYQTRIDGFEQRLATREATLRRQFTGMETALAQLNAQGNWLSGQLNALNGLRAQ